MSKPPLGEFGDILSWEQIWLGLGVEFEEFHRLMKVEEDWYAVFGNTLLVNTEHLQKIWKKPEARRKLGVLDQLAIIKAAARKILEPDFPNELLPNEFVVLGQDAADDRIRALAAEKIQRRRPLVSSSVLRRHQRRTVRPLQSLRSAGPEAVPSERMNARTRGRGPVTTAWSKSGLVLV